MLLQKKNRTIFVMLCAILGTGLMYLGCQDQGTVHDPDNHQPESGIIDSLFKPIAANIYVVRSGGDPDGDATTVVYITPFTGVEGSDTPEGAKISPLDASCTVTEGTCFPVSACGSYYKGTYNGTLTIGDLVIVNLYSSYNSGTGQCSDEGEVPAGLIVAAISPAPC